MNKSIILICLVMAFHTAKAQYSDTSLGSFMSYDSFTDSVDYGGYTLFNFSANPDSIGIRGDTIGAIRSLMARIKWEENRTLKAYSDYEELRQLLIDHLADDKKMVRDMLNLHK